MSKYRLPSEIKELTDALAALPGVGPRTAGKLAVYLVTKGTQSAHKLQTSLATAGQNISQCQQCGNLSTEAVCSVCTDSDRSNTIVTVVETPNDLIQVEQSLDYQGRYIVLGGLISPVNGISVDDLNFHLLESRIKQGGVAEVVLALSSTVEGEATSMYATEVIMQLDPAIKISRLARGLPSGVGIEYLDENTLGGAFSGRTSVE